MEDDDKEVLDAFDFAKSLMKITSKLARILQDTVHVANDGIIRNHCANLRGMCGILYTLKQQLDTDNYNPVMQNFNFSNFQQSPSFYGLQ